MGGLPRVGGYGTPRMHGACLPLCSAPVPMCHKAQGLHTWEIVGLLEPWRGWSWLGNEKGHRVGSWKANRASGVDTHAQGLRYKDNTNVLTMVYVDTHRLRHTQRNRDTHTRIHRHTDTQPRTHRYDCQFIAVSCRVFRKERESQKM